MRGGRGAGVALAAGAVAVVVGGVLGVPGEASAASTVLVPGSVTSGADAGTRVGAVPASQQLTVQVWLAPDLAGASAFANAVATPGSAEFHHYLSPDAYTARFGPSAAHETAIAAWLSARGLTGVRTGSGRDYVSASGPVSKVRSAFGVHVNQADGGPAVIRSGDGVVSMPASLAPDVLGVTGLNSVPRAATSSASVSRAAACSHYWAQHVHGFRPGYRGLTKGSPPVCGYSAGQIRAAYGATPADSGKGQTVALTEDEAPTAMLQTLKDYAKSNHLPAPKPGQFREVQAGGGKCGTAARDSAAPRYEDESEMDSEAVYAMAPGADQVMVVGGGCDEDQALLNAALAVLTGDGHHPSASIESNSWQIPIGEVPTKTVHAIDLRAAAEGVGMYFSSGDTPGLTETASDPYSVAVGGTTLGVGAKNNRVFETGWSNDSGSLDKGKWTDQGISLGSGGGTSLVYGQPAYQKGVVPASMSHVRIGKRTATDRTVPDIAADADLDTGMLTGYIATGSNTKPGPYRTQVNAGTSLACPLIAGLVADAQQGRKSGFGFINPLIYRLSGTRAFHDILPVTGSTPQQDRDTYTPGNPSAIDVFDSHEHAYTQQVTARGYDTMTGLGTPNGAAFIAGLRRATH